MAKDNFSRRSILTAGAAGAVAVAAERGRRAERDRLGTRPPTW